MLAWLLLACTPVLHSPEGGAEDTGAWIAPDNGWPAAASVPAGLEAEGWDEGDVVPDVRLPDQFGDTVSLWQFYGMVVAVDVSTMWCAPCASLADEVDAVWNDYRDRGFIYVTLLPEDTAGEVPSQEDLQDWAEQHGISAPVLSDGEGWSYQIAPDGAYPHVLVVGRDLRVVDAEVTPVEDSAIRAVIEAAL